jgi:hypothetical protein
MAGTVEVVLKIIFLDVDGVLNSADFFHRIRNKITKDRHVATEHIDPLAVKRLSKIVDATGAKIVISSVWRYSHKPVEMQKILGHHGFKGQIIGATARSKESKSRGKEIDAWLSESGTDRNDPVECFVILDDDADMDPHTERLVQTNWQSGLQDVHVRKLIKMLGRKSST